MEPEVEKLITESINVNYVDAEQYPSSTEIQNRCYCITTAKSNTNDAAIKFACCPLLATETKPDAMHNSYESAGTTEYTLVIGR